MTFHAIAHQSTAQPRKSGPHFRLLTNKMYAPTCDCENAKPFYRYGSQFRVFMRRSEQWAYNYGAFITNQVFKINVQSLVSTTTIHSVAKTTPIQLQKHSKVRGNAIRWALLRGRNVVAVDRQSEMCLTSELV